MGSLEYRRRVGGTRERTPPAGPASAGRGGRRGDAPGPAVRWFVRLFLAAFVLVGLTNLDAWPLTGWRLFSSVRGAEAVAVEARAVDAQGRSRVVRMGRISAGLRGFELLVKDFPALSREERDATCAAWLGAVRSSGIRAVTLEIDLLRYSLLPRDGDRPANPPERILAAECTDAGAEVDARAS
jgi:hypothetical protein